MRGADFSRIGLYLDGVLLHEPFHMLQGQQVSGSATAFNGDIVEELELHEGAFPVRYEDRTAAVLDNLTNRTNYIYDSFNGYNSKSFQALLTLDTMFPILPSARIVFER